MCTIHYFEHLEDFLEMVKKVIKQGKSSALIEVSFKEK